MAAVILFSTLPVVAVSQPHYVFAQAPPAAIDPRQDLRLPPQTNGAEALPPPALPMIGGYSSPIRERDAGRRLSAGIGTTVVILLPSNARTGYAWQATQIGNATLRGITRPDPGTQQTGVNAGAQTSIAYVTLDQPGPAEADFALVLLGTGHSPAKRLRYRFSVR